MELLDQQLLGEGGEGAEVTSRGDATINGGLGGEGGHTGDTSADKGASAFLSGNEHEDPSTNAGGAGGNNGAAIRKVSGINFNLIGSPSITGSICHWCKLIIFFSLQLIKEVIAVSTPTIIVIRVFNTNF